MATKHSHGGGSLFLAYKPKSGWVRGAKPLNIHPPTLALASGLNQSGYFPLGLGPTCLLSFPPTKHPQTTHGAPTPETDTPADPPRIPPLRSLRACGKSHGRLQRRPGRLMHFAPTGELRLGDRSSCNQLQVRRSNQIAILGPPDLRG